MNDLLKFFSAINDETRLRLFTLLANNDFCVCELTEIMGLSQPKVSKHLSKLRDLGFVETKRESQFIFYHLSIKDDVIKNILETITRNIDRYPILAKDQNQIASCTKTQDKSEVNHG